MKNIVVCFDRVNQQSGARPATNTGALFALAECSPGQLTWYDDGAVAQTGLLNRRTAAAEAARSQIVDAYRFLVDVWAPGDEVFVFGVGRGATCAAELSRLLGTIGVWQGEHRSVLDYLLDTHVLPRTRRTGDDWRRVSRIAAALTGRVDIAVPVRYLGLWDAVAVPGVARRSPGDLANVVAGRHAVAIDGGTSGELVRADAVEEVWFRGAHCDVAGTAGGCLPLADVALDWVLDGAARAGVRLRGGCRLPSPTEFDALAGSSQTLTLRRVPEDAAVHASVEVYLRARPQYWRRLPTRLQWADPEWLARGERLVAATPAELPAPVRARELAAAST